MLRVSDFRIRSFKAPRVTAIAAAAIVCVLSAHVRASCPSLAFNEALGFGRYSAGGSGGPTYTVTDLSDYGYEDPAPYSHTLRYFIEQVSGPRIIQFAISGTVQLKRNLVIDNSYITIDGRTSDNLNITVSPYPQYPDIGQTQIKDSHDIIIRYMRFRQAPNGSVSETSGWRSLVIGSDSWSEETYRVIVDHCSIERSGDDDLNVLGNAHHVTVQWCLIGNGDHSDCFGSDTCPPCDSGCPSVDSVRACLVSGYYSPASDEYLTLCHNLIGEAGDRAPKIGAKGQVEFFNNAVMNCVHFMQLEKNSSAINGVSPKMDIINNYFSYPSNYPPGITQYDPILTYSDQDPTQSPYGLSNALYISGNYFGGGVPANQWDLTGVLSAPPPNAGFANIRTALQRQQPWPVDACYAYSTDDASAAMQSAITQAGCRGSTGGLDALDADFVCRCATGTACIPPVLTFTRPSLPGKRAAHPPHRPCRRRSYPPSGSPDRMSRSQEPEDSRQKSRGRFDLRSHCCRSRRCGLLE
jgi:pectate lyase